MKKKFILLAMMLLTLIGGVKFNVLNAQETIEIGEGSTSASYTIPSYTLYGNRSFTQQIYTAGEINAASGNVISISFKKQRGNNNVRNISVYMENTDKTSFTGNYYEWIFLNSEPVYEGTFDWGTGEGWVTINLSTPFEYNGGGILLSVYDNTGVTYPSTNYDKFYTYSSTDYKAMYVSNTASMPSTDNPYVQGTALKSNNQIRLTFEAAGDDIVPAAPTNLVATTVDYKSVNLTWVAAENALKYQVWQGENMIAETDQTEYLVEGLSDGTEYCFTVKSVRYNNNTSDASSESCATTAVLPVPGTPVNLAATNITHNSVTLTWDAVEYAESYTVSYTGGTITVTENTCDVTGLTPETNYTFSVTANNTKGSSSAAEVSATTLEYNDPFAGKLFRIKVNSGNTNTNGAIGKYLNIFSYNKNSATNMSSVGAKDKADTEYQKFIIESAGNGNYYLKNTAGYYIKCAKWNVDAFSTTEKTALTFEYVSGSDGPFYLRDSEYTDDKTNNYFKAEYAYNDGDFGYNYHVYSDQPITNTYVVTWTLEEVVLSATATTESNSIYDDQTTTLSVTAMDGSGNYTYSWSPANGLSDATSANPTFTPTAAGEHTFTCTVTDTESNATTEASVTVYVYARPTLYFTVYADKELIYNDGETAVLTATVAEGTGYAPYTYSWTLNGEAIEGATEATYTFSNTTVGEYTLTCTVTDARNNTQTASTTIEVKDVSEKPLEIVLGISENLTTYYPTSPLYENSYSQQIYTASEINKQACDITSISFMKYNNTALSRNIKVFMLNVNKDEFTNKSDWVSVSDSDIVFEGNFDFAGNQGEWTTIDLTNKFSYTGGDILLCVNDFTGVWRNDYPQFYSYTVDSYRSLASRRDDTSFPDVMSGSANYIEKAVNHIKFGYEIPAPKPESLVATPAQIHVGETTTLTWNELEGAESYNIYVDGVLNGNTKELTYGLSDLTYNVEPGHTIEVAAVYADATESGKASVTVQVAGTFTLTVNVTDGTNPMAGVDIVITTLNSTTDEFGNAIEDITGLTTDESGQLVVPNMKVMKNGEYGYMYQIIASKGIYKDGYENIVNYASYSNPPANGDNVTREIVMTLPEPQNVTADKELYIAGEDVVLTWETPEFNTRAFLGYNVYSVIDGDNYLGTETSYTKLNEETLTGTTYTIENVEYGAKFAVSAVYNEGESSKVNAYVQITTYANLVVNVKDANTSAGIDGAVVEIYSYRTGETETFVTENGGIVEEEYLLGYYTVTVKKNDSHYEVEPQEAQLVYGDGAELEFALTPKASIENVTVTADNNGNVSWTGDYTKWNVYRRNVEEPQELETVATEVATTSTTDAAWETLEPGTYQYGVAALVEPQAQTRGTEVILKEDFETTEINELPEGWTKTGGNWRVTDYSIGGQVLSGEKHMWTQYSYSGEVWYLVMPALDPTGATLSFYYRTAYEGTNYDRLTICYSTSPTEGWININEEEYNAATKTQVSIPLDDIEESSIYIAFCMTSRYSSGIFIDDVLVTREKASLVETQIVWSNDVVKQGPATFEGTVSTDWNLAENWSTGSVPADGAEVTINDNAVIKGAVNVSNVTINAGTSLTVANGGALTVTGTISQASNYLLVLEEGGQIFQNNANVTARFRMSIDNPSDWSTSNKDGWQFISMPLENVPHTDFTSYGEYDLYKYDGSQNLEWQNHKDGGFDYGGVPETTFKSGVGYLASLKDAETATVYGTLNTSTSFSSYFAYNADKDLANFRLIGNPFTYDIKWGDMNPHQLADGFAIVNKDGGYEYYSDADADIKVGQGFFIKAIAGETSYSQYNYSKQNNYSKQRSTRESNNSLNITATGNAGKDNVVINFAGKSEGFDKLQNFNDAIAIVYVAEGGKNYGIYNCDADVQEVELSFNANKMGNYTISIEPNGKFQTVTLVDRFTGVETNMLVEDYNFTAMSSDNHNRFIVRFANGQQTTDNSHFVYQSGEELILNIQGEVQIVDVLGRVVYNGEAMNDINRINVSSFNSGAYMVKVMNGNEVKVEKVVIY